MIGYTSITTCCESLRLSRCHFLSGVAGSLAGKQFFRFVNPQRWDQELCCAGVEEGVSYGFILHSPDHLTALHLIPVQTIKKHQRYTTIKFYDSTQIKHLVSEAFSIRGYQVLNVW